MSTQTLHPIAERVRKELRALELETLTRPYSLADAIREGSRHSKQQRRGWFGGQTSACAFGAGFMAAWARGFVSPH